jgi:hypothetical protein
MTIDVAILIYLLHDPLTWVGLLVPYRGKLDIFVQFGKFLFHWGM